MGLLSTLLLIFWQMACAPPPTEESFIKETPTASTPVPPFVEQFRYQPPRPSATSQKPVESNNTPNLLQSIPTILPTATKVPTITAEPSQPVSTKTPATATSAATPTFAVYGITQTVGISVNGYPIVSHRFGYGTHKIAIVGGIHGGYEWNTVMLAYELIDFFNENEGQIPNDVTLFIIPSANPDGQFWVTQTAERFVLDDVSGNTEPGRFNGNTVDLNRNWACDWSETGYWGQRVVQTGERPFSEPESQALSRFFVGQRMDVVVFLHSAANGIFLGSCPEPLAETETLGQVYSDASSYPLFQSFSSYPVTGDASDWLATKGIPSFSVELRNHGNVEFVQNLAGVKALITYFNEK